MAPKRPTPQWQKKGTERLEEKREEELARQRKRADEQTDTAEAAEAACGTGAEWEWWESSGGGSSWGGSWSSWWSPGKWGGQEDGGAGWWKRPQQGQGSGAEPTATPEPPRSQTEDMDAFRALTMTPSSFASTRQWMMALGRPVAVPLRPVSSA